MNITIRFVLISVLCSLSSAVWKQTDKLIADDADALDPDDAGKSFASAVAIDGDFLVVGAPSDNDVGTSAGAAYVYQRDLGTNTWLQTLKVTGETARDNFGQSVATQGNYFVVGAPFFDGANPDTGAVYVYKLDDSTLLQKIEAASLPDGSLFGSSLAIDLPYLVVGAPLQDGVAENGGAVYVYKMKPDNSGFDTPLVVQIVPDEVAFQDLFGFSVGISGNVLVAGSTGVNNGIGAAYIYKTEDDGISWVREERIRGRATEKGDQFGQAVDIEDGIVVVGAKKDENVALSFQSDRFVDYFSDDIGKAYVFAKRNGSWKQTDHLRPLKSPLGKDFGTSVAIRDGRIIVGAPLGFREQGTRRNAGAVYLFAPLTQNRHKWRRGVQLTPKDVQNDDNFGISVSYSAGTLVVGSNAEDEGNFNEGAAYVFFNPRQD